MKAIATLAALLVTAGAAQAQSGYWSDNKDYASDSGYAKSMALCRAVKNRQPPASDRPDAATANALKGCSSETLYYGIGVKTDPARARQCAFVEDQDPDAGGVFSGKIMLMTIYANGRGAKRDLDLAMRYACDVDGAPAEYDGRVRHLAEMKTKPAAESFDFCNDITSGLAGGYCASHDADIAKVARDAKLAALTAKWTPAERAAFAPLSKAAAAYVDAHGDKEVDMSGTARAQMEIDAEEAVRNDFVAMLETLSAGRAPRLDLKAEDAKLNAAYLKIQRGPGDDMGTVTKADIKAAQRVWLTYRDAFVAFAKVKWPAVPSESIAAWMTQTRTKLLEGGE